MAFHGTVGAAMFLVGGGVETFSDVGAGVFDLEDVVDGVDVVEAGLGAVGFGGFSEFL